MMNDNFRDLSSVTLIVLRGIASRPASLGKFAGGWRRSKFALANLQQGSGGAAPVGSPIFTNNLYLLVATIYVVIYQRRLY